MTCLFKSKVWFRLFPNVSQVASWRDLGNALQLCGHIKWMLIFNHSVLNNHARMQAWYLKALHYMFRAEHSMLHFLYPKTNHSKSFEGVTRVISTASCIVCSLPWINLSSAAWRTSSLERTLSSSISFAWSLVKGGSLWRYRNHKGEAKYSGIAEDRTSSVSGGRNHEKSTEIWKFVNL